MKVDRSLQEVWDWKDEIYKESKDKSAHGIAKTIRLEVDVLRKSKRFPSSKIALSR